MSMEEKLPPSPIKSREEIIRERKIRLARKILWTFLSVVGIIILVIAFIIICTTQGGSIKKSETEKIAINALKQKLENPSSLKVLDISVPDSVFYNRICPEYETMELSERFLQYSLDIMQKSQTGKYEDESYRCSMERFTESSNLLNYLNESLDKPQGQHCGWRVKVKYKATDETDTPYTSETWFIFDKDKKHILNSFDISIL